MKLILTREEMLARRRLAGGFEPLRTDCTVEETAGTDINAMLELQLRCRYLELLDTADPALLAPEDVAADTAVTPYIDGGSMLTPPAACRRVLAVWLEGWEREAGVIPAAELKRAVRLQRNPFTSSTAHAPMAVALPDGQVAAWPASGKCRRVMAICDAGPDIYKIDERALGLLCESKYNPTL